MESNSFQPEELNNVIDSMDKTISLLKSQIEMTIDPEEKLNSLTKFTETFVNTTSNIFRSDETWDQLNEVC